MPKQTRIVFGDRTELHAAYPNMYPLADVAGLSIGDVVHCRTFRESRKGGTAASATLVIEVQSIAGEQVTGIIEGRLATYGHQALVQQDGDVVSFEMRHIENVVGREHPLHNGISTAGIHFRNFLLDERLFHKPGEVAKVVGGLPMPIDKMSPHDIENGNWTGHMVVGEEYQEGMPLVLAHGYSTLLCIPAAGFRRDDSFMKIIAANDTGTHERVEGVWQRVA